MSNTTRRHFLKQSVAAASLGVVPYFLSSQQPAQAQAPSDRLRVGLVGVGGMGRGNGHDFSNLTDVVAIADVDSEFGLAQTLNHNNIGTIRNGQKVRTPDAYKDYRRILDRNDIDIVAISTPDQWHVKPAIEALQAGKHVFCEKPLTLTIEEGELVRRAVRRYPNLVFKIGSQQRSQRDQFARACLMVRRGMLGEIRRMTVDIHPGDTGGPFQVSTPPNSLDFNEWLGQSPLVNYIRQRTHGSFRWWYEYSGGKFTDWGAHHIDFAHWALNEVGEGQGPISFEPTIAEHPVPFENGYPTVSNHFNTAHRYEILCKFASGVEMVVASHTQDGCGILIEGTEGRMHVNRGRIAGRPIEEGRHEALTDADYAELANGKPFDGWHKRNFITCIREGGVPISDVISHIQAMQSCHLCALAVRLNRKIEWNPKTETIIGDDHASTFLARQQRRGYEIPRV